MIQRKDAGGSGGVSQQVVRLTELTDELRDTVQGLKQGKAQVRRLFDVLKREHGELYRNHVQRLKSLVEAMQGTLDTERSQQKQALQALLAETRQRLEQLDKDARGCLQGATDQAARLDQQVDQTRQQVATLETQAGSVVRDMSTQWDGLQKDNTRFQSDLHERVRRTEEQSMQSERTVVEMRQAVESGHEEARRLDSEVADSKWRVNQLEAGLQHYRELSRRAQRNQWISLGVLALGLVWALWMVYR